MPGFVQTSTGWAATAEQIAFWESRDTCPMCSSVVEPVGETADGQWAYTCLCDPPQPVEWTRAK